MHPLSLQAYREKVEPTLTQREGEVLAALRAIGKGTCYEVADHMKVRANKISGRFKALKQKGRIEGKVVGGATVWTPIEPKVETSQKPVTYSMF